MNLVHFNQAIVEAFNAGAEAAMLANGMTKTEIDNMFLRNVKFKSERQKRRVDIVERNKKKLKEPK